MRTVLIVGGLAESLLNFRTPIIRALRAHGVRVVVAAPAPFSDELTTRLRAIGAEVRNIRLARAGLNPLADLLSLWSIWRVIREVKPQAFLAYTAKPVIFGGFAASLARVQMRCAWITGLGFGFTDQQGMRRSLIRWLMKFLYRLSLRGYHSVLFQNNDDALLFRQLGLVGNRQRVDITAGSGVDTERFVPSELPAAAIFLMAARLLRDKGVYEYVAAAHNLRSRWPDARFLLAGGLDPNPAGVSKKDLDAWCQSGDIEYLGWVDDISMAMQSCRIYVLPSYREGMPRSVLEAMAMGRPVITTDAPGCRDAVEAGLSGLIVPVRDASALERAMERFICEPELAIRMGKMGRELAAIKFDARKVSERVLAAMDIE